MIHHRYQIIRLVLLVGLAFVLTACSGANAGNPPAASQAQAVTQTNEGGQVTVSATWNGAVAGPIFQIALNTHSVDLDGIDLVKVAVLRTDQGQEVHPSSWDAPKGGHHRSGTLTFPAQAPDGQAVLGTNVRSFDLVIRDVAGVPERVFTWTR